MNIRNIYWGLIIVLSGLLLFEWTSQKREQSIDSHLDYAEFFNTSGYGEGYSIIENDKLFVVVATRTGSIIETRLKEYPVENVKGSLGFRVFGSSTETAFNYYFKSGFTGMNPVYILSLIHI